MAIVSMANPNKQVELDRKVSYLFARAVDNFHVNENLAHDALRRLEQISLSKNEVACFKSAWSKEYEKRLDNIENNAELKALVSRYLPIYPEMSTHKLFSEDTITNTVLLEKLFEHEEWVVNMRELSLVLSSLWKNNQASCFCTLIDKVLSEPCADFSSFYFKDLLIAPFIHFALSNSNAAELLTKHEETLVELVKNHRRILDREMVSDFDTGINATPEDCELLAELGAEKLAAEVFTNSLYRPGTHESISLYSDLSHKLKESFKYSDELLYITFARFSNVNFPYDQNLFKFFAYAHMHGNNARLPFHPNISPEYNGGRKTPKNGIRLNKPEMVKGLGQAIAQTSLVDQDKVNELIHTMKTLIIEPAVLAAMARELPEYYRLQHPDLRRRILEDDLSL